MFGEREEDTAQFVRLGTVSSVNRKNGTARVFFDDRDETLSHDLRIVVKNTMNHKSYWIPDVDEQVLCVFLPNGEETGFILGSIYSDADKPIAEISDEGKPRVGQWFEDGTFVKYELDTKTLFIHSVGDINIEADGDIKLNGRSVNEL